MVLETKKNNNETHNHNMSVGEDKISNLPDELIHHILSFLPTKCALSTCTLSKRWKYLSNSIPTLDFRRWQGTNISEEDERLKTQQFMNFLDTVLYHHEKPNIQKFYLTWDDHFDESRLNKWIGIIIKRKVKELFLSEGLNTCFILPLSFYTCDSLTVLELDCVELNVPNTVSFPRLKILRLENMVLNNGLKMEKLFSNCPILEELSLIQYDSFKSQVLYITNHALKNLHIRCCELRDSTMKICAPNLSTISYTGKLPADFVFDSFPSLSEAVIDICSDVVYPAKKFILIKLFKNLCNVKLLKMSGDSLLVTSKAEVLLTDLPVFNNLIHLEISSEVYCTNFCSVRILFRFLQLSPCLESIVFSKSLNCTCQEDDYGSFGSPGYLRSVKFEGFNGMQKELDMIKLFLKYAGVVKTMTVVASPSLSKNHDAQTEATMQLQMLPKPINCVVNFLLSSEIF